MSDGFDWSTCVKDLTNAGFTPICDEEWCETFAETVIYHANCADQPMYVPVQSPCCLNSATGETKYGLPPQIMTMCQQLHDQDPNWNLSWCYCCCGGAGDGADDEGGMT